MAPSGSRSRKMKRGRKGKKSNKKNAAKSKQLNTYNKLQPWVPRQQTFMKTSLGDLSGAVIPGGDAPYWALGGVTGGTMPDWNNVILLYNRYKIKSVKYTYNVQPVSGVSLFNYDMPKIYIRYNYDSNLSAGLLGANILAKMQEVSDVKVFQFTPEHTTFSYKWYPRCIEPVYLSSIATGYRLAKPQFIDTQYSTVPHYGVMYYLDKVTTGLKITIDIQYEIEFKYEV